MPRKLRIEYEGAVYHVISRGNYRADVFARDATRAAFLKCLDEACLKSGWRVHAWCVMSNHYHLCIETPSANLVAGMKWLQATFSLKFNRLRSERGRVSKGVTWRGRWIRMLWARCAIIFTSIRCARGFGRWRIWPNGQQSMARKTAERGQRFQA